MNRNLRKACRLLAEENAACVFCREEKVYVSHLRGVAPLMEFLDQKVDVRGFSAADRVVGKAAAFLYCLLQVDSVYARVISREALEVLQSRGITIRYQELTDRILNRTRQGDCPLESAVRAVSSPETALTEIRSTLKKML